MKMSMKMKTLVILFTLAPLAFGQEKQQEKKTYEQLTAEWNEYQKKRSIEDVTENRADVEKWLAKHNEHLKTRTKLTEKIKRALADGDGTLIEVAVSELNSNRRDLENSAEWIVNTEGRELMSAIQMAYKDELITEEVYTGHLKFFRSAKARTEEPLPADLVNLIKEARKKVPDYFSILERVNGPIRAWQ